MLKPCTWLLCWSGSLARHHCRVSWYGLIIKLDGQIVVLDAKSLLEELHPLRRRCCFSFFNSSIQKRLLWLLLIPVNLLGMDNRLVQSLPIYGDDVLIFSIFEKSVRKQSLVIKISSILMTKAQLSYLLFSVCSFLLPVARTIAAAQVAHVAQSVKRVGIRRYHNRRSGLLKRPDWARTSIEVGLNLPRSAFDSSKLFDAKCCSYIFIHFNINSDR